MRQGESWVARLLWRAGGGIMSFYLRKTVKAGPFRVSLSRSGIGVSTGVSGLRGSAPGRAAAMSVSVLTACITGRRFLSLPAAAVPSPRRLSRLRLARRLVRC